MGAGTGGQLRGSRSPGGGAGVTVKAGLEAGRESSELVNGFAAEGTAHPAGAITYEQMDSVNI